MDTERSRAARDLAQNALVTILHELGEMEPPLILLGGLVPDILTGDRTPPAPLHLGTTDVDVLLDLQVAAERDLSRVESTLLRLGFRPSKKGDEWRWIGNVQGTPIKLEFLCELDDQPNETALQPRGCDQLRAMNLRGTGFVRHDPQVVPLKGTLPGGVETTVSARVAGLAGYLLAKATAMKNRSKEKDYYDFAYVLSFNKAGGPVAAAAALKSGSLAARLPSLKVLLAEVEARFLDANSEGPVAYERESLRADPAGLPDVLRQEAVSAVADFMKALRAL